MTRHWLRALGLAIGLAVASAAVAGPETEVDLALVIAVDVSYSMDTDEQELQREGFAEAFRSPLVHDAIRHGMLGRIGVTYAVVVAGPLEHNEVGPRVRAWINKEEPTT